MLPTRPSTILIADAMVSDLDRACLVHVNDDQCAVNLKHGLIFVISNILPMLNLGGSMHPTGRYYAYAAHHANGMRRALKHAAIPLFAIYHEYVSLVFLNDQHDLN